MRVALDAMGGDFAPRNIVEGAVLALNAYPHLSKLYLVGDQAAVESELRVLVARTPAWRSSIPARS